MSNVPTAHPQPSPPQPEHVNDWLLGFDGFDPASERHREALCTLGNGYMATRGALSEATAAPGGGPDTHYPGTYCAGLYNRLGSTIAGRHVTNESMVNLPNWLPLTVRINDGPWLGTAGMELAEHRVELDMTRGVLVRTSVVMDPDGRRLRLTQRRFVSMRDTHVAAMSTTLTPEGFSGRISVRSALDGRVRNSGVRRYRDLPNDHLTGHRCHHEDDEVMCLHVRTNQSQVLVSQAARTRVFVDDTPLDVPPVRLTDPGAHDRPASTPAAPGPANATGAANASGAANAVGTAGTDGFPSGAWVGQQFDLDVTDGQQVRIEKVVWMFTSRDNGSGEPATEACSWARATTHDFDALLARHVVAWRHLWEHVDIGVGTDGVVGRYVHLHLFHVLQTMSPVSVFADAGVPARGLHGEAYRGHVFWDEVFVLPFLSLRLPQIARSALMYRYRRLDMARRLAAEAGFSGAMFPWQSGSNGREETQTMHLNPVSGRWLPDASHLQRHVNAAIAYNVWHYYQATADTGFLTSYGGELMLEIARFWASAATYNHALDRYEIRGVVGPDEYHQAYPGGPPGIDNNAYTNIMAVWCVCRAFEVLEVLPPAAARELRDRIALTRTELDHWGEVSRKMRVCFHDGVISQFEGFDDLAELDWDHYRQRYGDISRLDRILEAEGDTTDRYKLTKQADVMMLFFLLSAEELSAILQRLGYGYDTELIPATIAYYEPRTAHGSTLSRVVHAWIHARANRAESWRLFCEALHSDVNDIQGGTTAEGIHLGAMAGTIDLLQRCYTGLELTHDRLRLNPVVPDELAPMEFAVRYRTHLVHLRFDGGTTTVRMDNDEGGPITVEFAGVCHDLAPGHTLTFD